MDKNVFREYLSCLNSCQLHNKINPSAVYWKKNNFKGIMHNVEWGGNFVGLINYIFSKYWCKSVLNWNSELFI